MNKEPLSIVIVAPEKDVKNLGTALKGLSRKVPVRMHYATQAIEGPAAFGYLHEKTGRLDAAFIHNRFTAPGKEPYSEVLGKTLKRKFPKAPIIGFGKKSKAGSKGKHYHEFLETDEGIEPQDLLEMLYRLEDGDINPTKTKEKYRRLSMDEEVTKDTDRIKSDDGTETRAFPKNAGFRKPSWTGCSFSQPGSPGAPYMTKSPSFKSEASYYGPTGGYRSGPQTPTGMRTPTSSHSPTAQLGNTPNAELIQQLSQELDKLRNLIFEKKTKEAAAFVESQRQLEVRTHDF